MPPIGASGAERRTLEDQALGAGNTRQMSDTVVLQSPPAGDFRMGEVIADKYRLPVHFIGVGEGVDDLEPFAARDFARAIAGFDA